MIKEVFYSQYSSHDAKIIIGDFNTKISKEIHKDAVGKHSLHNETNENASKLVDFALRRT